MSINLYSFNWIQWKSDSFPNWLESMGAKSVTHRRIIAKNELTKRHIQCCRKRTEEVLEIGEEERFPLLVRFLLVYAKATQTALHLREPLPSLHSAHHTRGSVTPVLAGNDKDPGTSYQVSHNIRSAQRNSPTGPSTITHKVRPVSIIKCPALGFVFNFKIFNLSIVLINSLYAHACGWKQNLP